MANLRPPKRSENDSPMQMGVAGLAEFHDHLAVFRRKRDELHVEIEIDSDKFPISYKTRLQ